MGRLKVLVFCPWAHSSSYYTAKFCNALTQRDIRVFLIAPENFMTHLLSKDIQQVQWPYISGTRMNLASLLRSPLQAIKFLRIMHQIKPDWIHFLWIHQVPILLIPWLKKFHVAYTVHDPALHSGEGGRFRSWIQRKLVSLADVCFVHGEENKKRLAVGYNVDSKYVYSIPHGEFMFWDEIPDIRQEKIILFFGRIRKYKGLNVLLDAFEKVRPYLPDYRLFVCGEGDLGDLRDRLQSTTNVDVMNRFVEHSEIPSIFLRSRFLVLPYIDGTQSGIVPMAFALGRTCVVSSVGSIPEVVHHEKNGLLVRPGNSGELAEAILRLASEDVLRSRLEEGALRTARNSVSLSWERAAAVAVEAYKSQIEVSEE